MGNFNRDDRGGRRDFDRPRRNFGNDRGGRPQDRQMHSAVCSNCGKDCQVPFKPTGAKPIFCSDCFEKNGGGARREGGGDRFSRPSSFGDRNSRPSSFGDRNSRPSSFGDRNSRPNRSSEPNPNSAKLDEINAKLDKILRHLFPVAENVVKAEVVEEKIEEKVEEEKVVPVKKTTRAKKLSSKEAPIEKEVPLEVSAE